MSRRTRHHVRTKRKHTRHRVHKIKAKRIHKRAVRRKASHTARRTGLGHAHHSRKKRI